ncbi:hypothetical protein [Mesorhizobium sp. B1-1-8]|uniref:hypothetical protein n=1 Tax=Mesorhizobium sp. B1-1-8 TaxID=2589976 RepID=UPI001D0192D5|nr:hypothetical protein [Mesorhizobium sp. B1-1-8]UCI10348.1 hypothetical protein FJ974_11025 [Mesorhizobium sp. B1-1-8]
MAVIATAGRSRLQELRGVLESQRTGGDGGVVTASVSVALTTGGVTLSLVDSVIAIVMVAGITRCRLFPVAVAIVGMATGFTA